MKYNWEFTEKIQETKFSLNLSLELLPKVLCYPTEPRYGVILINYARFAIENKIKQIVEFIPYYLLNSCDYNNLKNLEVLDSIFKL